MSLWLVKERNWDIVGTQLKANVSYKRIKNYSVSLHAKRKEIVERHKVEKKWSNILQWTKDDMNKIKFFYAETIQDKNHCFHFTFITLMIFLSLRFFFKNDFLIDFHSTSFFLFFLQFFFSSLLLSLSFVQILLCIYEKKTFTNYYQAVAWIV